jgi:hypothetical protein
MITALALAGCATMDSTPEELRQLGAEEGIVFGSIVVETDAAPAGESALAFLAGGRSSESDYSFFASEVGLNPFVTEYGVTASTDQERAFVKKLPAGDYAIKRFKQAGLSNLEANIDVRFSVHPGEATYVGRLTVYLPYRLGVGSRIAAKVHDVCNETLVSLGPEVVAAIGTPRKELMIVP